MKNDIELHFCEGCAYGAGVLLARIAELESALRKAWRDLHDEHQARTRTISGVRERVVLFDEDAPPTRREPAVTRQLASGCR